MATEELRTRAVLEDDYSSTAQKISNKTLEMAKASEKAEATAEKMASASNRAARRSQQAQQNQILAMKRLQSAVNDDSPLLRNMSPENRAKLQSQLVKDQEIKVKAVKDTGDKTLRMSKMQEKALLQSALSSQKAKFSALQSQIAQQNKLQLINAKAAAQQAIISAKVQAPVHSSWVKQQNQLNLISAKAQAQQANIAAKAQAQIAVAANRAAIAQARAGHAAANAGRVAGVAANQAAKSAGGWNKLAMALGHVGKGSINFLQKASPLARIAALISGMTGIGALAGIAYVAGRAMRSLADGVVGATSELENYNARLLTLTRNSKVAAGMMDWAKDFAQKTPYQLNEVIDAMVRLTAYGFKPMQGQLLVIGDFAAAMGRDVQSAVEAVADAAQNEWERMKEFAIRREDVERLAPRAFNKSGQMIDKAAAMAAMFKLMEQRGAGGMARMMDTIAGKWSNAKDKMWNVLTTIGGNVKGSIGALIDFATEKLDKILDLVKQNGPKIKEWLISTFTTAAVWVARFTAAAVVVYQTISTLVESVSASIGGFGKYIHAYLGYVAYMVGFITGGFAGAEKAAVRYYTLAMTWEKAIGQLSNRMRAAGAAAEDKVTGLLSGIFSNTSTMAAAMTDGIDIMGGGERTKRATAFERFRLRTSPGLPNNIKVTVVVPGNGGVLENMMGAVAGSAVNQFANQLGIALGGSGRS